MGIAQVEHGPLTENIHVGLPVRFECAYISPIARLLIGIQPGNAVMAEVVRERAMSPDGAGQDVATEIM